MTSEAFKAVLARDRELFNQKFAEARRRKPELDPSVFGAFLRQAAAPIVQSAAEVEPERATEVAHAAFDAALSLVGERLAGPGGRHAAIDALWVQLLPELGSLVADQPAKVIGSLSNAVFNLATTPGTRVTDFLASLVEAGPALPSVADLLRAGQVAAWRAGLSHLRQSALEAGDALPGQVACALMGAPKQEWGALRERLAADAWYDPAAPELGKPRLARRVGAFRGFGGSFLRPPRVFAVDGHLAVASHGECWFLSADAFGATLHRADAALLRRAAPPASKLPLAIPGIGAVTSLAQIDGTLAVTGDATHSVALIAVS